MKKLGLIGGVGPESTITYYKGIVYGVQKRVGRPFFPNLTIESLSSYNVLGMSSEGKYAELTDYLMTGINCLVASGADFAAMACSTGHVVFDDLEARSPIPLVSIVEATCAEAKRQGLTKIGLLGTMATMEGTFFRKPFEKNQIEIVTPMENEKAFVIQKLSTEVIPGIIKEETAQNFRKIVQRMVDEDGIQAIVLGCTELPLLFNIIKSPVPCLDTVQFHVQTLIDNILAD